MYIILWRAGKMRERLAGEVSKQGSRGPRSWISAARGIPMTEMMMGLSVIYIATGIAEEETAFARRARSTGELTKLKNVYAAMTSQTPKCVPTIPAIVVAPRQILTIVGRAAN